MKYLKTFSENNVYNVDNKPLVVYHGSSDQLFNEFKINMRYVPGFVDFYYSCVNDEFKDKCSDHKHHQGELLEAMDEVSTNLGKCKTPST